MATPYLGMAAFGLTHALNPEYQPKVDTAATARPAPQEWPASRQLACG